MKYIVEINPHWGEPHQVEVEADKPYYAVEKALNSGIVKHEPEPVEVTGESSYAGWVRFTINVGPVVEEDEDEG